MRILIAQCEVNYSGRLDAHLPLANRVIMVKADGSVLIHSDGGSYKPLNWMSAPCQLAVVPDGEKQTWTVTNAKGEVLVIDIANVLSEVQTDLGVDPGLEKDGVEAHLQELLAAQVPQQLGEGWTLVRREWPTPIGPVDLLVRDAQGKPVAVEVKRRGEIAGVEQLSRYLELLGRKSDLAEITGVFAAQEIKPQARTLAEDRGIRCVLLDYDEMRGMDFGAENRLF